MALYKINQKKVMICLEYMYKSYTFASAFENESSDQMTFWLKGESLFFCLTVFLNGLSKKKQKNFRKNLEDMRRSSYLCNRFSKESRTE